MIVGFNHNISYKGVGFHVQTEDSGVKSPHLVTLLYHGGTIIASKKTVYADILKVENLSQVVEELAKEQHKGMLRRLTQGEFDQRIVALNIPLDGVVLEEALEMPPTVAPKAAPQPASSAAVKPSPVEGLSALPETRPVKSPLSATDSATFMAEPLVDKFRQSKQKVRREPSLDDLIYAYLSGADEC